MMIEKRVAVARRAKRWYTATEVAAKLGIQPNSVRVLAHRRGLGQRFGVRGWAFTERDIAGLQVRKVGRPRKVQVGKGDTTCTKTTS